MQIDMHFYGTYAVARAAGLAPGMAQRIATAAQYVDDAARDAPVRLPDGGKAHPAVTSSHRIFPDPEQNAAFQWRVWMPFHFLPGGAGRTRAERLVCRRALPGNPVADAALSFAAERSGEPMGPLLLGILCHVTEDTFSHHGFTGGTTDGNRIEPGTLAMNIADARTRAGVTARLADLRRKDERRNGELGRMGHLSAGELPDRPHLIWRFRYAVTRNAVIRDNPADYLAALERVHGICAKFAVDCPASARSRGGGTPFLALAGAIREILACEAEREERCERWLAAMRSGRLFTPEPGKGAGFPRYDANRLDPERLAVSPEPRGEDAWSFAEAAEAYRAFVLEALLPRFGLARK